MYFSDEIYLVTETAAQDEINQFITEKKETAVWCDLTSITGNESVTAGQNGHKASGRAVVHMEDYSGETLIRYDGENVLLPAGYYDVYRTFFGVGFVELYLEKRAGD